MYKYKLEWVRFHDLDSDEELKVGRELQNTVWYAEEHEDLVRQLEEHKNLKIRYIAYYCTRDKNETDNSLKT